MSELPAPRPESDEKRWVFIRDVVVFQVKLVIDGLRDAVLIPLSIGAALLDLIGGRERSGRLFYHTVAQGRRTESWIGLFEAADRGKSGGRVPENSLGNVDELVGHLEKLLVEQHQRGGITASAKEAIDRALDSLPTARR